MPLPLEHLTIQAFRGLADVELANLARVNLLVGPNDSGKTSVLEALCLLSNPLDVRRWDWLAGRRLALAEPVEGVRWLFPRPPGTDPARRGPQRIGISCHGTSPIGSLSATAVEVAELRAGEGPEYLPLDGTPSAEAAVRREVRGTKVDVDAKGGGVGSQSVTFTVWDEDRQSLPEKREPLLPCRLVMPWEHWFARPAVELLSRARLQGGHAPAGGDGDPGTLLAQVDPRISGVEVLAPDGRGRLFVRDAAGGLVPISVYGDGVRRCLMLAAAVVRARGGLLLVDEIETAIHVAALGEVFGWLVRACVDNDVQLFATTHSLEAIDALLSADATEELTTFRLTPTERGVVAKGVSGDMLGRLRFDRGLDIR